MERSRIEQKKNKMHFLLEPKVFFSLNAGTPFYSCCSQGNWWLISFARESILGFKFPNQPPLQKAGVHLKDYMQVCVACVSFKINLASKSSSEWLGRIRDSWLWKEQTSKHGMNFLVLFPLLLSSWICSGFTAGCLKMWLPANLRQLLWSMVSFISDKKHWCFCLNCVYFQLYYFSCDLLFCITQICNPLTTNFWVGWSS